MKYSLGNKIFTLSYSVEKCGICGSMNTMVTDHRYRCFDCGYDDPYTWD